MFPIILVFILRESVDRSDNPTSRRNMNSRTVAEIPQPDDNYLSFNREMRSMALLMANNASYYKDVINEQSETNTLETDNILPILTNHRTNTTFFF